jgi:hypothetical protein
LLTGAVEGNSLRRGLTIKLLSGENRRLNERERERERERQRERERERENPVCEYEWGRWEENSRPRYMGSVSALCVVQPVHPAVIPWLCAHSGGLRFGGKKQLLWDFLYPAHTDTVLWCKWHPAGILLATWQEKAEMAATVFPAVAGLHAKQDRNSASKRPFPV